MSRLCVFLWLLALSPAAAAWSVLGHRLVGELAERHLEPAARAEVASLLAGEPRPGLAGVASWADFLRDDDPDRFRRTSPWHYVNFPRGRCDYRPERDCPGGNCVVGAILAQQGILADRRQPPAARRDALKFLVHLVGDVHQPMHAGNRGDKGGNAFQVSLHTDLEPETYARRHYVDGVMGTNLHSVWDYYILATARLATAGLATAGVASEGLTPAQYADRLDALPWPPATGDTGAGAGVVAPQAWALESCRLLDSRDIYPRGHRMDHAYLDAMRPLAEQRVRQAAWRLATLLNETLGS